MSENKDTQRKKKFNTTYSLSAELAVFCAAFF